MNKTYSCKPKEVERQWWLIDAQDIILGRLASRVANILRGKHKPSFTPNVDCGDHVVIINAEKVALSGKKLSDKIYYWHTGYPGGIKNRSAKQILNSKFPERIIENAVSRMISRGPLQRDIMKKLHIYCGQDHKHQGQTPKKIDFAAINKKNIKN